MANTKTLILPLEIIRRELDARLLHALIAANRGWDVFMGANAVINRSIWRFPSGVFLFSTLTHRRLFLARLLKKIGFATQGWDEEGLIYLDRDVYLTRRVSSETLQYIDQIFAWGEQSARDIDMRAAKVGKRAIALGNPRFDLLRPELRAYHEEEAQRLRERFGPFVLFNANFPSVNFIVSRPIQYTKATSVKDREFEARAERNYRRFIAQRQFMFEAFRKLLPALARALPRGWKLVVRPHPAERIESWEEALRGCENVHISDEGSSVPWVLAAQTLVHNDCTTAVEARLLGKEPIAFIPEDMPEGGATYLPNAVSHRARDLREVLDLIAGIAAGEVRGSEQEEILNRYVAARTGPLAAERAVDMAEELLARTGHERTRSWWRLRAFCVCRHLWKKIKARKKSDEYISRVFPDTSAEKLRERLQRLADVLGMPAENLVVERMGKRLFRIRKKG